VRYVALAETAQADSPTDTVAKTAKDPYSEAVADTVADTAAYPNPQAHAAEITASGHPAERDRAI